MKDPVSDHDGGRIALQHGKERAERKQSTLGMVPAQESFGTSDRSVRKKNLRLVVQLVGSGLPSATKFQTRQASFSDLVPEVGVNKRVRPRPSRLAR